MFRKERGLDYIVVQNVLWLNGLSLTQCPGEQLFTYWQTGVEPQLEVSFAKSPNGSVDVKSPYAQNGDLNYDTILRQTLHTTVTLWEESRERSEPTPEWLLHKEAEPLLPPVRRALQVMLADERLVAALRQDFGQETAIDFLRELAVRSSARHKFTFIDAAD